MFADLEAQIDASERVDREAEIADRSRRENALISLFDRCRAAVGARVTLHVIGAGPVSGRMSVVSGGWVVVSDLSHETLVPLPALVGVSGLPHHSAAPGTAGILASRLGLTSAMRGLARDRAGLSVTLVDASVLHGTIDRVGRDYLELAMHEPGAPRRPGAVRSVRAVPLGALAAVRSA